MTRRSLAETIAGALFLAGFIAFWVFILTSGGPVR